MSAPPPSPPAAGPGEEMHRLAAELFPIARSITGDGVRRTLARLAREVPLEVHEVPTGTPAGDWTVPREWNIRDAWIEHESGRRFAEFSRHNLHVVGYSTPVDRWMSREELQAHLHSLPDQPDAIPFVTSYYQERWGFCLSHREREALPPGRYRAYIDSDLSDGSLTYGELVLPGRSSREVFLSTYVCHPSMANNELSGPVVTTQLAKWLAGAPRRHTYRIAFVPETIGALVYLSRNLDHLRRSVVAGFNVTCVGDDRAWNLMPSRRGDTLADRVALSVLRAEHPGFTHRSYLDRGSDERQYCSPGADLPVVSVMRSMYRTYPEYHTSLDDLRLVTPTGLAGAYEAHRHCIELIEANRRYRTTTFGEPQLGRRGLYPTLSAKGSTAGVRDMMNLLAYADGTRDLLGIADVIGVPAGALVPIAERLAAAGVVVAADEDPAADGDGPALPGNP